MCIVIVYTNIEFALKIGGKNGYHGFNIKGFT